MAVFRLITSSNLVDCSTGKSAGFAPLRNAGRVDAEAAMAIEIMRAIAHKSSSGGIGPSVVDRRNGTTRRQRDDLIAAAVRTTHRS